MFADPLRQTGFRALRGGWPGEALPRSTRSAPAAGPSRVCVFQAGSVGYCQGGFDPRIINSTPAPVIHALVINEALSAGAVESDSHRVTMRKNANGAIGKDVSSIAFEFLTESWRRFQHHWADTLRAALSRSEMLSVMCL